MTPSGSDLLDLDGNKHVKLLLVDDHRVFAEVLALRLRRQPGVASISVAHSLGEARANLNGFAPDLVLLDAQLDGESGLDLIKDVRATPRQPPVLMLSGQDQPVQVVDALRAGAQGWVTKTVPFETLMLAASEVLSGHVYLSPVLLKPVLQHLLAHSTTKPAQPSFVDDLTERQTEVLRCLVDGMSRAECAQRLHLSIHTVRTYVQQLLKRAEVHSTLALAARARELGVVGIDAEPVGTRRSPK